MQRLGTDHSRPAARTSMVGGTGWCVTSPIADSSSERLPTGARASFSRLANSSWGGSPVVPFGSSLLRRWMRAMAASSSSHPSKSPS